MGSERPTVELLVAFSVACGNVLRYVLPLGISLKGRCIELHSGMSDVNDVLSAIDDSR